MEQISTENNKTKQQAEIDISSSSTPNQQPNTISINSTSPVGGQAAARLDATELIIPDKFVEQIDNPLLRPTTIEASQRPFNNGAEAPISFTPVFLNFVRFNEHGPFQPKFSY